MIYVTGDTHGDFQRLSKHQFPIQKEMTKDDFVIICGDFGGIWAQEETNEEKYWLNWLDERIFTTVFCDGNHENFDRLYNDYEVVDFCGGKAHKISEHIYHLIRGEIFKFEGKLFLTIGGGETHDVDDILIKEGPGGIKHYKEVAKILRKQKRPFRVYKESWWPEELPSKEEMDNGIKNLEKVNYKVDVIISHSAPTSLLKPLNSDGRNQLTDYLQAIMEKTKFTQWLFGHYHKDMPLGKCRAIYKDICKIE